MPDLGADDARHNGDGHHADGVGLNVGALEVAVNHYRCGNRGQPQHEPKSRDREQVGNMNIRIHRSLKYRRGRITHCCGTNPRRGLGLLPRTVHHPPSTAPAPIYTEAAGIISGDTVCMASTTFNGLEVLISRQQIAERVAEMGEQITRDLKGEKLVMVGVLKGAAFFLADLSRAIDADATFDFIAVKSYPKGSQTSSGAVQVIKDLDEPIEGKNVLIVEDILDTGLTLAYLRKIFLQQHPKSLRIATLLDKPSRRVEKIEADYVGFAVPNLFVIGYGMDFAERYRNLPDICLMPPDQPL